MYNISMKKYCVYCHTNKINGKKYIGITSQKPQHRWKNGQGYRNNEYFFRAIEKYGWHNFTHEILYTDLSKEVLCVETGKVYLTMHEASKQTGAAVSAICSCCKGKAKTAGGFRWKYAEEFKLNG